MIETSISTIPQAIPPSFLSAAVHSTLIFIAPLPSISGTPFLISKDLACLRSLLMIGSTLSVSDCEMIVFSPPFSSLLIFFSPISSGDQTMTNKEVTRLSSELFESLSRFFRIVCSSAVYIFA